jgi:hypothetical protein
VSESPSGGESDTEGVRECLLPPDILTPPAVSGEPPSMEGSGISSLRRMLATFSAMPWDSVSENSIESSSFWEMSTPLDTDPEEVPVVREAVGDCTLSAFADS